VVARSGLPVKKTPNHAARIKSERRRQWRDADGLFTDLFLKIRKLCGFISFVGRVLSSIDIISRWVVLSATAFVFNTRLFYE
jgi:hypothetical protein